MGSPASADRHDYRRCADENCPRFPCQVFKEGFGAGWAAGHASGYAEGFQAGYGDGYEAGYKQGFSDGIDACPGPHGKG